MIINGSLAALLSELGVLAAGLLALVAGLELVYLTLKRKASLRAASRAKRAT